MPNVDHLKASLKKVDLIASFKKLNFEKCGVRHCTGDKPIAMFKKAFGVNFVPWEFVSNCLRKKARYE